VYFPLSAAISLLTLMTQDRVHGDEFPITQQFLSEMLGVNRPTVSNAQSSWRTRAYQVSAGTMKVLDRRGLEEASCECYELIRERFDRLGGRATGGAASNAKHQIG
jgi:hypothetical protein